MALEVVTGTSQRMTTSMMQRSHYAIIHTASAHTIRSTGLLLRRHCRRQWGLLWGRHNSVQYVGPLLGMIGLVCNMPLFSLLILVFEFELLKGPCLVLVIE
jgi:hypothetical protein